MELTLAESHRITAWIDLDRDGDTDADELIAWEIEGGGDLTRAAEGGPAVIQASGVIYAQSGFSYDAAAIGDVTRVGMELVVDLDEPQGASMRSMEIEVALRNAGGIE